MPLALATKTRAAIASIALAVCCLAQPRAAEPSAESPARSSAQAAPASPLDTALLAGNCVTCHGPDGRPPAGSSSIPALRGQTSAALLERMQAFKAGRVAGATVMPLLMQGYDLEQMQALARWFAAPPGGRP